MSKRIAIVNKIFWPEGNLIGKALLGLTNNIARINPVVVITQSNQNISELLGKNIMANPVVFEVSKSRCTRTSSISLRVYDALIFMFFVFIKLVKNRPDVIYVSTNPPIMVPFIVFIYSKLFGAKYLYHVQDIHPEATRLVTRMNSVVFYLLRFIDSISLRGAALVVTLTEQMKHSLHKRKGFTGKVYLVNNPANDLDGDLNYEIIEDQIIYVGTLGRFQRIPLLIKSIRHYLSEGGGMKFLFCGEGVYADEIRKLEEEYDNVKYSGLVRPEEAARLTKMHKWALLPIDDDVTDYAFPCKTSTYLAAGCNVVAICSKGTAVAEWIDKYKAGIIVAPDLPAIVSSFFKIEKEFKKTTKLDVSGLREKFSMRSFSDSFGHFIRSVK